MLRLEYLIENTEEEEESIAKRRRIPGKIENSKLKQIL